ncbi:MAG: asparagine synthase (glutamine-hydrolyzing) [Candidatus Marinimicrobia bacterium]|nr:asparagine synthase (glutamine-hydrolyzing) [Candidatus Neomarinimicrobiota bacterium]|tara:strand:+ start:3323 stop:4912 length:1590 start_codon:yes stop_codon:yes gene_type:complete
MCGIFSYKGNKYNWSDLSADFGLINYRGPDNSHYERIHDNILFGFHRLAIMGVGELGNQPMKHPDDNSITLICNGEIYNYRELANKYGFDLKTGSDSEIILRMYKSIGIEKTVLELDGVFMFVLHDAKINTLFASRDPMGVRPGFLGTKGSDVFISSEAKPIINFCDKVIPFPPGTWWSSDDINKYNRYFYYQSDTINEFDENILCKNIRNLLIEAVKKRLMSEREIGCLLSGGLDSSLITSLVSKYQGNDQLNTFSIGMKGSIDLEYSQHVANFLNTKHHQIIISENEFLNAIETVIYNIESYDTTTVRASVGNYLVSKYIKENTDCKVIFNGDGSDEVCCGYVYLKNAPSKEDLQNESERLIKEIFYFDVLRSDRSISSNGLEARTPFLDKAFVKYYLSIPAQLKQFNGTDRLEKYLLRKAFDNQNVLPNEVLWRRKCAFSDGVSSQNKSWHKIIQHHVDGIITDKEFLDQKNNYKHCPPQLKESYYYRKIFDSFFEDHHTLIPHYWMPKWTSTNDPSARELVGYSE